MKRANRQAGPQVTQRYRTNGHLRLACRMVALYYFSLIVMYLFAISQFFFGRRHKVGWPQAILRHTFEATIVLILHSQSCFVVRMPHRLWLVQQFDFN
jgi:hypothetical protein